jgi:periplasmic divalent cation tolerance protein
MESGRRYALVLVTAPERKTARKLVRLALEARLAACSNLIPGLESHYWWQGKIETSREVLILLKTKAALLRPLEQLIARHHPYDTPEFISFTLSQGSERYLRWIEESTKGAEPRRQAGRRASTRKRG